MRGRGRGELGSSLVPLHWGQGDQNSLVWGVGNKPARVFNTEEKPLLVAMAGGGGGGGEVDEHGGEQQVGPGHPHRQLEAPGPPRAHPQHLVIGGN